jgi:hypothetical protein
MAAERLPVHVDSKPLLFYQAQPLSAPRGGEKFKGSNFIHPLKTPSGFVLTQIQPWDHKHHLGLWWPWKYIETAGRKVLCWELQKDDGLIRAVESKATENGFVAKSEFIDRKAPGGPVVRLNETLNATVSGLVEEPARGYFLDLEIIHRPARDEPITVTAYRYSGFSIRGTEAWNKNNSTILTSEGKERYAANFSRARWVRVQGDAGERQTAGVLMMSRPDNYDHPEKLRTWDKQHGGAIFVNFNSVQAKPWVMEPGKDHARNFRLFVYDGDVSAEQAETLWKAYAGR